MTNGTRNPFDAGTQIGVSTALAVLREAWDCAQDVAVEPSEFAVETHYLLDRGVTVSQLRWLAAKGFVQHRQELTTSGDHHRNFGPPGPLCLCERSCVLLTPRGIEFELTLRGERTAAVAADSESLIQIASQAVDERRPEATPEATTGTSPLAAADAAVVHPAWDIDRKELSVAGVLVKRYKVPSMNQERILAAFTEEGWPYRIDDPLPPAFGQDPKVRLNNTIKSLNRHQRSRLVRFMGDGSGTGVCWELF
jgi:hypothetical protein